MLAKELQKRAAKKLESINRARNSARFRRVMGKLKKAGLIFSNVDIESYDRPLPLKDYLWAGGLEPRIFELLPALILKKPSYFESLETIPPDLVSVLRDIRKGTAKHDFRGIPAAAYTSWVDRIGHRGKAPGVLKTFRLKPDDLQILRDARERGMTEAAAVREGLRLLKDVLDTFDEE